MRESSFRFRLAPERGRVPAADEAVLPPAQDPPEPPGQAAVEQHLVSHGQEPAALPQPSPVVMLS